jgi:phosphohistidine phosphatase
VTDFVLWRHADAEPGVPDLHRALTPKGQKQAKRVAHWLHERLPPTAVIYASPARRAQETALALAHLGSREFVTVDEFAPSAPVDAALGVLRSTDPTRTVVVVGHQPTLGELASRLLGADLDDWPIRKGAVVWLAGREDDDRSHVVLRAAIAPDLV